MKRIAQVRKSLGFPTIFNLMGPLINPAFPKKMIVGVHSYGIGQVFAEALRLNGVERALVVCGEEGLDEVTL
jgi:anthranilate phosphoribosyltransferase